MTNIYESDFQLYSSIDQMPASRQIHRREVLWQITIPIVIGALIILALAIAVPFAAAEAASRWADVSLIWLILPMLFAVLVFTAIIAGLVYAVLWLNSNLFRYTGRLYGIFLKAAEITRKGSNKAAEPFIRVRSWAAGWDAFWRNVRR